MILVIFDLIFHALVVSPKSENLYKYSERNRKIYINIPITIGKYYDIFRFEYKIFHIVMVWLIPFLWYYLVKGFIISNMRTMTKEERDRLSAKSGGFRESGKGMY